MYKVVSMYGILYMGEWEESSSESWCLRYRVLGYILTMCDILYDSPKVMLIVYVEIAVHF